MLEVLFDTSATTPVVAIVDDGDIVATAPPDAGAGTDARAQTLIESIDGLLKDLQRGPGDIDALGVGVGPGGFTGLRIGVATARALSIALDCELRRIDSLEACAWPQAMHHVGERVWADIDARRNERFLQPFRAVSGIAGWSLVADEPMRAVPIDDVARVVGGDLHAEGSPTAEGLRLASQLAPRVDPYELVPQYGRGPDARRSAPNVRVREAQRDDLEAMSRIEHRAHIAPWTDALLRDEFGRDDDAALRIVAVDAHQRVVGFALVARIGDAWHILDIVVDPDHQRMGIGGVLMSHLLAEIDGRGADCTLEVRESNVAAIALYERAGFVREGERPGYYHDNHETAIVMWRRRQETRT